MIHAQPRHEVCGNASILGTVLHTTHRRGHTMARNGSDAKTYFEQQRQLLIGDVAAVCPSPGQPTTIPPLTRTTESGERPAKHQQAKPESGGRHCRMSILLRASCCHSL